MQEMVMAMVMAKVQAAGKELGDFTPDEINIMVQEAVADLKLAIDAVEGHG